MEFIYIKKKPHLPHLPQDFSYLFLVLVSFTNLSRVSDMKNACIKLNCSFNKKIICIGTIQATSLKSCDIIKTSYFNIVVTNITPKFSKYTMNNNQAILMS